ncbi:hypothetical protein LguiB_028092 [Lonicera macranthoides]
MKVVDGTRRFFVLFFISATFAYHFEGRVAQKNGQKLQFHKANNAVDIWQGFRS